MATNLLDILPRDPLTGELLGASLPEATISGYTPPPMERLVGSIGGLLGGDREAQRNARPYADVISFLPGAGDYIAAREAQEAFDRGDNLSGGLLTAATVIGGVPLLGPAVKPAIKAAADYFRPGSLLDNMAYETAGAPSRIQFTQPMARNETTGVASKGGAQKVISGLTEEEGNKLEDLATRYPAFYAASKNMDPVELRPLLNMKNAPEKVEQLLRTLPAAENFAAAAKMGAPKVGWYDASARSIHDIFGDDSPRFAALLAATSPQTSVEMNLQNSLSIWKNWTLAGRPKDPKQIMAIMGDSVVGDKGKDSVLGAWVNNSIRALASADPLKVTLSGPKVDSFYRNLIGNVQRVTNDAHMSSFARINQDNLRNSPTEIQLAAGNPGMTPEYATLSALQRQAGNLIGYTPAEVQESVWSITKPLMEMQKGGMGARDSIQGGLLTPDVIRGTVDFSSLLREPTYAEKLIDAGYGQQLSDLPTYPFGREVSDLTLDEQNQIMAAAARLEDVAGARARESMAKTFMPPDKTGGRAIVNMPFEATPYADSRMTNLVYAPYGARANYTSRVGGLLSDDLGQDIINESLGLLPLKSRPMQGAYIPPSGVPEFNPGINAPVEVQLTKRGEVSKKDQDRIDAALALRGGLLTQGGSPSVTVRADEAGKDAIIRNEKKLTEDQIKEYAGKYGTTKDAFVVDTGKGAILLNQTDQPLTKSELEDIGGLLGDVKKRTNEPGVAASEIKGGNTYFSLEGKLELPEGSGEVAQAIVDKLNNLSAADFKRLDNDRIRELAAGLNKIDLARGKKGEPIREDIINMRRIIAEKGLAGLKAAVKAKEFLPSLAAIGILPALYERLSAQSDA